MADNTVFQTSTIATLPSGFAPATDDIGGVAYQRVKITLGADGTNDGDVSSSNPVPVAGTVLGSITETAPATDTASSGLNGRLQRIAQRLTSIIALLPTSLGQKLKAASLSVVIASDQDTLAISVASLPLPSGAATAANQATLITQTDGIEGLLATIDGDTGTIAGAVSGSEVQVDVVGALPAGTNNIGDVDVLSLPAITGTVTANAGTGTFTTKETRASTATLSNVNDTASSTILLASNANRLGAMIYNDSTVNLYLKLGATASTTSFTVLMIPGAYYEVPFNYTGIIDGIWASDASGAARVTEVTA